MNACHFMIVFALFWLIRVWFCLEESWGIIIPCLFLSMFISTSVKAWAPGLQEVLISMVTYFLLYSSWSLSLTHAHTHGGWLFIQRSHYKLGEGWQRLLLKVCLLSLDSVTSSSFCENTHTHASDKWELNSGNKPCVFQTFLVTVCRSFLWRFVSLCLWRVWTSIRTVWGLCQTVCSTCRPSPTWTWGNTHTHTPLHAAVSLWGGVNV